MSRLDIFAERFRFLRQRRELTQKALAQKLSVAQQKVNTYEMGGSLPSLEKLVEIAQALITTTDYLVGLSNDPDAGTLPFGDLDELEIEALKIMRSQSHEDKKRLVEVLRLSAR